MFQLVNWEILSGVGKMPKPAKDYCNLFQQRVWAGHNNIQDGGKVTEKLEQQPTRYNNQTDRMKQQQSKYKYLD